MLISKEFNRIHEELPPKQELIPLSCAKSAVPNSAGLYAIYIDSIKSLPSPFSKELETRNVNCEFNNLLYIGKAEHTKNRNLNQRLVSEALMVGTHTFFCVFSAVFDYTPTPRSLCGHKIQNNFKFTARNTSNKEFHWTTYSCSMV